MKTRTVRLRALSTNSSTFDAEKSKLPSRLYKPLVITPLWSNFTAIPRIVANVEAMVYIDLVNVSIRNDSTKLVSFSVVNANPSLRGNVYANNFVNLKTINISNCGIESINVTNCSLLTSLNVGSNSLVTLDLSGTNVLYLDAGNNQLTEAAVDSIFTTLDAIGGLSGTAITLGGSNAAPSLSVGFPALSSLVTKGWTIQTN